MSFLSALSVIFSRAPTPSHSLKNYGLLTKNEKVDEVTTCIRAVESFLGIRDLASIVASYITLPQVSNSVMWSYYFPGHVFTANTPKLKPKKGFIYADMVNVDGKPLTLNTFEKLMRSKGKELFSYIPKEIKDYWGDVPIEESVIKMTDNILPGTRGKLDNTYENERFYPEKCKTIKEAGLHVPRLIPTIITIALEQLRSGMEHYGSPKNFSTKSWTFTFVQEQDRNHQQLIVGGTSRNGILVKRCDGATDACIGMGGLLQYKFIFS